LLALKSRHSWLIVAVAKRRYRQRNIDSGSQEHWNEGAVCTWQGMLPKVTDVQDASMPKRSPPHSPTGARPSATPPTFSPAVVRVPKEDFKFTDSQFTEMEKAGAVEFSEEQRADLLTLADFWINDLRLRRTARPKEFRECLDEMITAFLEAEQACNVNEEVGSIERHLLHWAMETPVQGAAMLFSTLGALEHQLRTTRETLIALKQYLPPDPGRQRPFDDERRIIFLADIFEAAGGKSVAYAGGYYEDGNMTDTPFRRFAQRFYSFLPADDKRVPGGLDEALRHALSVRRTQRGTDV
jgi:hypothetical protein